MAASTTAVNLGGSVWLPYKELFQLVDSAIYKKDVGSALDLEISLKKHKLDFVTLVQYPVKSIESRTVVQKACIEGIAIQGQLTQILPKQIVEEALIVSDLFNLNEIMALELILAGENQLSRYPGYTRGLVAVLLYYDGQRCLISSLRGLVQARRGNCWTLGLADEVVDICTQFTDELWKGGIFDRITDQLQSVDVDEIRKKLGASRALGNPRHRSQVMALVVEIRTILAECIFCWACQSSLSIAHITKLLDVLSKLGPVTIDSSLDGASLALIMSVLYSFDSTPLVRAEDAETASEVLHLVSEPEFIPSVHNRLTRQLPFEWPALKRALQFAWAVTLRNLSEIRIVQEIGLQEYFEEDETLIDEAIEGGALRFLANQIVENPKFHQEEFYVHRMHILVTDFIVQMPLKIKELRNRGDETARIILSHTQEGIVPPRDLPHYFEELLQLISSLYAKDPHGLKLSADYWHPPEQQPEFYNSLYSHWPSDRQMNLYKFVRLAGDLLPQSLYLPYVTMLNSLSGSPQTAHNCFNLLKLNGTNASGKHSIVSWDHFFYALNRYYTNMRLESPLVSDTHHLYQQRTMTRGITPQELEALVVVLKLTRTIISQYELARVALYENTEWVPQVVLFGLLGCSVPPNLKAQLLLTLAAFAKSPDISISIWQLLEASQIFNTLPNVTGRAVGCIQVDLEEVEARNEEYPITCAFLELLINLADSPNPETLGLGHRAPGYDPFLQFVINSVLLNFLNRAFKHLEEKWKVASLCLELLHKLLCQHEITVDDFSDIFVDLHNGGSVIANKKPAFNIMIHMLRSDRMLKMIFQIVDEVLGLLDQYVPFQGKEKVERSALFCLKLLDATLEKQEQFIANLRESGSSFLVTKLDQLLEGINPRSGMADHLTKIAKFVVYNDYLPEHACLAVKILSYLAKSAVNHSQLLSALTAKEQDKPVLCHGFVECLEADDVEDIASAASDQEPQSWIRCSTRRLVLRFLIQCLKFCPPNAAHLLLGFNWQKSVSKSVLQDPGVLGAPYTCLHAVLEILSKNWSADYGPLATRSMPETCELAYQLIYTLCSNPATSDPTLRYLRTSQDFLCQHLQVIPAQPGVKSKSLEVHLRRQQAWLLKTVAVELRVTATNQHRSHLQRLLGLLVEDGTRTESSSFAGHTSLDISRANLNLRSQSGRKLLCLLHNLQFIEKSPPAGQWEYFDSAIVEQALQSCERETDNGVTMIDISLLHKTFDMELTSLRGSLSSPQHLLFTKEVQAILTHAAERNKFRQSLYSKQQAFESWRQVTEIILTICAQDTIENCPYASLVLDMTHVLLKKVKDPEAVAKLSNAASGVVMILLSSLRQYFLKSSQVLPQFSRRSTSVENISLSAFASSLLLVLKGMLECITQNDASQRVRAHYYTALLNLLKMTEKHADRQDALSDNSNRGREINDENSDREKLKYDNMEAILSFGETFFEVTCWDSCNARDVCKMLSLVTMLEILASDKHEPLVQFLVSHGYLRNITDDIVHDDQSLQASIQLTGDTLQSLYVFEAKMAFFIQIANSSCGCLALLDVGLVKKLTTMRVFDIRPMLETRALSSDTRHGGHGDGNIFFPNIEDRYFQVLLPTLHLCSSMVMVLGPHNIGAKLQVMGFLSNHLDTFVSILRARPSLNDKSHLRVLSLTTALMANTLGNVPVEDYSGEMDTSIAAQEQLLLLQREMLFLLPHFVKGEGMSSSGDLASRTLGGGQTQNLDSQLLWLQVTSNLLTYCKSIVMKSGPHSRIPGLIFNAAMDDVELGSSVDTSNVKDFSSSFGTRANLGIGLMVLQLQKCSNEFLLAQQHIKMLERKLHDIPAMNEEKLGEVAPQVSSLPSIRDKRDGATLHVSQTIGKKEKVLQSLSYMLEISAFLLWHHLQFYLVHGIPSDSVKQHTPSIVKERSIGLRRLQDFSPPPGERILSPGGRAPTVTEMRITPEELNRLKSDCKFHVTGVLLSKLDDIVKTDVFKQLQSSFMEAMVRRLRTLINLHTKL